MSTTSWGTLNQINYGAKLLWLMVTIVGVKIASQSCADTVAIINSCI